MDLLTSIKTELTQAEYNSIQSGNFTSFMDSNLIRRLNLMNDYINEKITTISSSRDYMSKQEIYEQFLIQNGIEDQYIFYPDIYEDLKSVFLALIKTKGKIKQFQNEVYKKLTYEKCQTLFSQLGFNNFISLTNPFVATCYFAFIKERENDIEKLLEITSDLNKLYYKDFSNVSRFDPKESSTNTIGNILREINVQTNTEIIYLSFKNKMQQLFESHGFYYYSNSALYEFFYLINEVNINSQTSHSHKKDVVIKAFKTWLQNKDISKLQNEINHIVNYQELNYANDIRQLFDSSTTELGTNIFNLIQKYNQALQTDYHRLSLRKPLTRPMLQLTAFLAGQYDLTSVNHANLYYRIYPNDSVFELWILNACNYIKECEKYISTQNQRSEWFQRAKLLLLYTKYLISNSILKVNQEVDSQKKQEWLNLIDFPPLYENIKTEIFTNCTCSFNQEKQKLTINTLILDTEHFEDGAMNDLINTIDQASEFTLTIEYVENTNIMTNYSLSYYPKCDEQIKTTYRSEQLNSTQFRLDRNNLFIQDHNYPFRYYRYKKDDLNQALEAINNSQTKPFRIHIVEKISIFNKGKIIVVFQNDISSITTIQKDDNPSKSSSHSAH